MNIEVKLTATDDDIEKFVRRYSAGVVADALSSLVGIVGHYADKHPEILQALAHAGAIMTSMGVSMQQPPAEGPPPTVTPPPAADPSPAP